MILYIHLYHFILKYNIYTLICKLRTVLKFGWLLLKPFSYRLYHSHSDVKHGYRLEIVSKAIENVTLLWDNNQFSVKTQVLWSNIDSIADL